jgi:hypothetical protein
VVCICLLPAPPVWGNTVAAPPPGLRCPEGPMKGIYSLLVGINPAEADLAQGADICNYTPNCDTLNLLSSPSHTHRRNEAVPRSSSFEHPYHPRSPWASYVLHLQILSQTKQRLIQCLSSRGARNSPRKRHRITRMEIRPVIYCPHPLVPSIIHYLAVISNTTQRRRPPV